MSSSQTRSADGSRRGNRLLEILAVVLLGIATIGSAWCGYQATRWNGDEAELARIASNAQTESARLFGLATQTAAYDSTIVAEYAQAVIDDNQRLIDFYRATLIRPQFMPVIERWEAQIAAGERPTGLLQDEEYVNAQLGPYNAATAESERATIESQEAGDHADEYVLTTLLLASALFFAGLTTSFRIRLARVLLLVGSSMLLAYAASRLVDLPMA